MWARTGPPNGHRSTRAEGRAQARRGELEGRLLVAAEDRLGAEVDVEERTAELAAGDAAHLPRHNVSRCIMGTSVYLYIHDKCELLIHIYVNRKTLYVYECIRAVENEM